MLPLRNQGFTLLEFLVVICVVAVLVSLTLVTTRGVQGKLAASRCAENLRTISLASALYSTEHHGAWPLSSTGVHIFSNSLMPYLGEVHGRGHPSFLKSTLICPNGPQDIPDEAYRHRGIYNPATYVSPDGSRTITRYGLTYAQNAFAPGSGNSYAIPSRVAATAPARTMLYIEHDGHYVVNSSMLLREEVRQALKKRHEGRIHVAFVDGSVRAMVYEEVLREGEATMNFFWHGKER